MSNFFSGFKHGLMHGMIGGLYGGWGHCCRFNMFCGCNTPQFYTPIMCFNNFNRYYTPSVNLAFPNFHQGWNIMA